MQRLSILSADMLMSDKGKVNTPMTNDKEKDLQGVIFTYLENNWASFAKHAASQGMDYEYTRSEEMDTDVMELLDNE